MYFWNLLANSLPSLILPTSSLKLGFFTLSIFIFNFKTLSSLRCKISGDRFVDLLFELLFCLIQLLTRANACCCFVSFLCFVFSTPPLFLFNVRTCLFLTHNLSLALLKANRTHNQSLLKLLSSLWWFDSIITTNHAIFHMFRILYLFICQIDQILAISRSITPTLLTVWSAFSIWICCWFSLGQ